jgi:indolepyruvate ferredoxin oxidoreductase
MPAPAGCDGKKKKGRIPALERELPAPVKKVDDSLGFGIHVMGIGGTGFGDGGGHPGQRRAAGRQARHRPGPDRPGPEGRRGDLRHQDHPRALPGSNKISDGRADLYLGFDILNATDPKNLDKCHPTRTIAVVSTTETPTGRWSPTAT